MESVTTTSKPIDRVLAALEQATGAPAKPLGTDKWVSVCPLPSHDDHNASLSVTMAGDGTVLLCCHACGKDATAGIVKKIGLEWKDLFPGKARKGPGKSGTARKDTKPKRRRVANTYNYVDEGGAVLFQTVRYDPKDFRQRRPGNNGDWIWNLGDVRRVLYCLPRVLAAAPDEWVFVAEGEKDADNLIARGLTATTNPMGAKKWRPEYAETLRNRRVCLVPDNDKDGQAHAEIIAKGLEGKAAEVRILQLDGLQDKGDVTDWLLAGGTAERLVELADDAPAYTRPRPQTYPRSDAGNALRLVDTFGERLRYCAKWGRWLIWDGTRWREDETSEVEELAKQIPLAIRAEANKAADDGQGSEAEHLFKHALRSEAGNKLTAMVTVARSDRRVAVAPAQLDADPFLLNVLTGTIDLRSGELHEHRQADMLTKLSPVEYDPAAECPRWMKFLREIMADDEDLMGFLQELMGLCLTGDGSEHVLPIYWGSGGNGKSTFLDTMIGMLGDYAYDAPPSLLTVSHRDEHPTELAALQGKRLVVTSETKEGRHLRASLVKKLTGDKTLTARYVRQDYFTFPRTFKTLMVTNHRPIIPEQTHAIWRRIRLVPFGVTIPENQQDTDLFNKLRREWSGILVWAVQGCSRWRREGLSTPEAVKVATNQYRREEDRVGAFLAERCTQAEGYQTPKARAFTAYQEWCRGNGEGAFDARTFTERTRAHGFVDTVAKHEGTTTRIWRDLLLNATETES